VSVRGALRARVNGVFGLVRRRPTRGRILLYHEVRRGADPIGAVDPEAFRAHQGWLRSRGLRGTTIAAMRGDGSPDGVVALSFDDGHASVVDACAVLVAMGYAATLFVVPAWVERGGTGTCSWTELAALAREGFEVGSHDLAHERPCGVQAAVLAERYRASKILIEDRLGVEVTGLAYPYGLAPAHARRAAALAGYAYAVTSEPGANREGADPLRLRRNEIHGTDRESGLIGKLAGTDDWFAPIRRLEHRLTCG